jgi:outer membrane lipoprotein-sorting protein
MKFSLLLVSILASQFLSFAQIASEPAAKVILDKVSAATDAMDAIEIVFEYKLSNKTENIEDSSMGELTLKKNQYLLSFMGLNQMSDGENVWTILTDDEEVQISEIDLEDENALTPANLLKMYENGFIYQLLEKTGSFQIIELIPDNPDEVDYIRIELLIDTNLNQIKKLTQFGKNATETTYIINNFAPSIVTDDAFEFKEKNYPGFDIIDLR